MPKKTSTSEPKGGLLSRTNKRLEELETRMKMVLELLQTHHKALHDSGKIFAIIEERLVRLEGEGEKDEPTIIVP